MSDTQHSADVILNRVLDVRQILQEEFATIRVILQKRLHVLLLMPNDARQWYLLEAIREALKKMGKGLDKAVRKWGGDFEDFYFWPGYETIHSSEGNSRVSLLCKTPDGRTINCGFSKSTSEMDGYCTIAEMFDRVLSPTSDILDADKIPFRPGGTHSWVAGEKSIGKQPIRDVDDKRLICLHVSVGDKDEPTYGLTEGPAGFVTLRLPPCADTPETASSWGSVIAESLNPPDPKKPVDSKKLRRYFHNYQSGGQNENWPSVSGIPDMKEVKNGLQYIRKNLYSIWLAVVFDGESNWRFRHGNWIGNYLKAWGNREWDGIPPLRHLVARIQAGMALDDVALNPSIRHWYTLHIEPTLSVKSQNEDLGSAMIFCSEELHPAFVLMVSSWVQKVFQSIRYMEGGLDFQQSAQTETTRAMGHEIKHVAKAFKSHWLPEVEEIFEVTSSDKIDGLEPEKIGRLQIDRRFLADMAVLPQRSLFANGSLHIRLWSMQDNIEDLPFRCHATVSLPWFVSQCWHSAVNAMSVHALTAEKVNTRERIIFMEQLRDAVQRVYLHKLMPAGEASPSIAGAEYFPPIHTDVEADPRPIRLGRIFISLFVNCIRHGDPLEQTRLSISQDAATGKFHFRVSDRRRSQRKVPDLVAGLQERFGLENWLSRNVVGSTRTNMGSTTSGKKNDFGGKDTMEFLLKFFSGRVVLWPDHSDNADVVTEIAFAFPERLDPTDSTYPYLVEL